MSLAMAPPSRRPSSLTPSDAGAKTTPGGWTVPDLINRNERQHHRPRLPAGGFHE
jgi:hypothetical protein